MTISKPRRVGEKDLAIGERIRTQRIVQKVSQEELASQLGLSFQQIQKYEKGSNRISGVRLAEIATILDTNVMTLLSGIDSDNDGLSTPISKFMATKLGVDLIEAMIKIDEPRVREAIVRVVQAIGSK
jgi:transcriptional regulator with XRE-family HTH domain